MRSIDPHGFRRALMGPTPRASVMDANEILGRAILSERWILSPNLVGALLDRMEVRKNSLIYKGGKEKLEELAQSFQHNSWSYKVAFVHPGFNYNDLAKDRFIRDVGWWRTIMSAWWINLCGVADHKQS